MQTAVQVRASQLHFASLAALDVVREHVWELLLEPCGDPLAHHPNAVDCVGPRLHLRSEQVADQNFDHGTPGLLEEKVTLDRDGKAWRGGLDGLLGLRA